MLPGPGLWEFLASLMVTMRVWPRVTEDGLAIHLSLRAGHSLGSAQGPAAICVARRIRASRSVARGLSLAVGCRGCGVVLAVGSRGCGRQYCAGTRESRNPTHVLHVSACSECDSRFVLSLRCIFL